MVANIDVIKWKPNSQKTARRDSDKQPAQLRKLDVGNFGQLVGSIFD